MFEQLQKEQPLVKRMFWNFSKTALKMVPGVGPIYELVDETVFKSIKEVHQDQINRMVELMYRHFQKIIQVSKAQTDEELEKELQSQTIQKAMEQFREDIQNKQNALESLLHTIEEELGDHQKHIKALLTEVERLSQPAELNLKLDHLMPSILHRIQQLGEITDAYEKIQPIPRLSGQGTLYRAIRKDTKQQIVLKTLKKRYIEDSKAVQRFLLEGFISLQLAHPNIVKVSDYGGFWESQQYFIEMEDLGEVNLWEWAKQNPYNGRDLKKYVHLILQGIEGIQYIHDKKLVHRDIKPSNFMIHEGTLKLIDFGTVKCMDIRSRSAIKASLTGPKDLIGTPEYMSPEQFDPAIGKISPLTDVYGLGVSLYELFTAHLPFRKDVQEFVEPVGYQKDIPRWLNGLILRMMEKKPEDRPTLSTVQQCLHRQTSGKIEFDPMLCPNMLCAMILESGTECPDCHTSWLIPCVCPEAQKTPYRAQKCQKCPDKLDISTDHKRKYSLQTTLEQCRKAQKYAEALRLIGFFPELQAQHAEFLNLQSELSKTKGKQIPTHHIQNSDQWTQHVEMQAKRRLEQEQSERQGYENKMQQLIQNEQWNDALEYYAKQFPREYQTSDTQASRDHVWNKLNQKSMDRIQQLSQQGKLSQAWELLEQIAKTNPPTTPEYKKIATEIALAYINSAWTQGQYKQALELCAAAQSLSLENQELAQHIARIQDHWQDLEALLDKMQQAIQAMKTDQQCSKIQVNDLLEIGQRLQAKKEQEEIDAWCIITVPEFSAAIQKSPGLIHVVERSPEVVAVLKRSPSLLAMLEKLPTLVPILAQTPGIVHTLADFPSIAPILGKFPNLAPILEQSPSLGMTFLRLHRYTCGGSSNEMLEFKHDKTGMEFVLIPGGTFVMGSPSTEEDRCQDEVQHEVTLSPYFMSKTLVTQAVWHKIMNTDPSHFKGNDCPVARVSWNDCISFCEKTGLALPTEAQWEFACRAGTQTAYYWGEAFDLSQCNSASYWAKQVLRNMDEHRQFDFDSKWQSLGAGRTSVGKFPPNAYGLYDMAGNVFEWCYDRYGAYSSNSATNPTGPTSGARRVYRGGSWDAPAGRLRSAFRGVGGPGLADYDLGFRVLARP